MTFAHRMCISLIDIHFFFFFTSSLVLANGVLEANASTVGLKGTPPRFITVLREEELPIYSVIILIIIHYYQLSIGKP